MVHRCTTKGTGALMTGFASRCRLNMIAWFADSSTAVMAVGAAADDSGMVHCCTGKCRSALMTSFAGS